jgi:hypothetical protein
MQDYKQNALLQRMKVQDLCCTYEDWIQRGRTPESMVKKRDSQGQWPFLSLLEIDFSASSSILKQLKKFLTYLLGLGNQMISKILERVISALPPMNWYTLSDFSHNSASRNCPSNFKMRYIPRMIRLHPHKGSLCACALPIFGGLCHSRKLML